MVHPLRFAGAVGILVAILAAARGEDWPQWRGPMRDGVWREKGLVEKFAKPELKAKWRAEISSGYSGPTVADGRVFVTDRLVKPEQSERVLCFDEQTGEKLWTFPYPCKYSGVSYEAGPRVSVSIDEDRAYALGTMGHLFCLQTKDGSVVWKRDLRADYQIRFEQLIWGVSASPLVDGDLLIVQVGGSQPGSCLVAFDKLTGEERWRAMDDRPSYSAPIIIKQAERRVLVCWTGDNIAGLDPTTGEVLWKEPFAPRNMVLAVATPVVEKDRLFLTGFYDGSMMLRLTQEKPGVEQIWRRIGMSEKKTDALHSIISTPLFEGDYVYGVDSYGELRCLNAGNGDRLWENLTAVPNVRWGTIHFVKNGDRVWMFNEKGELLIGRLSPQGFEEISRTKLISPTTAQLGQRGGVCWSHPAFANRHVFARNDEELVCADLSADQAAEPLSRIGFGSCARQDKPQPIWEAVVAAQPQLFLLLGDNIYGDSPDMDVLREKYALLGNQPGFKKLRQTCPLLATWDDHDYGANDAGGEFPQKKASQQVFLDFFAAPADDPRRKQEGIYSAQVFGPPGQRVQVILLDQRYFRSPLKTGYEPGEAGEGVRGKYAPDSDPATTVLGEAQWQWFEEQLRRPAEFRLIGSSYQAIANDHGWECWANFPLERQRLFRLIRETRAGGVVFLSGDRHLSEMSRLSPNEPDGVGYPLLDVTSSSLNLPSGNFTAAGTRYTNEINSHRIGLTYFDTNFGFIAIDWQQPDPVLRVQVRDEKGSVVMQQRMKLGELQQK